MSERMDAAWKYWSAAPNGASERATLTRFLQLEGQAPDAIDYATAPIRMIKIGGWNFACALGCEPTRPGWQPSEIQDVLILHPGTNLRSILGVPLDESGLVIPATAEPRMTVFADAGAFASAWIWRRLRAFKARQQGETVAEPHDGNPPGILIIGSMAQQAWQSVETPHLHAGPGVDAAELRAALIASRGNDQIRVTG